MLIFFLGKYKSEKQQKIKIGGGDYGDIRSLNWTTITGRRDKGMLLASREEVSYLARLA